MAAATPGPDAMPSTRDEVFRRFDVSRAQAPRYVVWELTLACDQHCTHCGSRAGQPRHHELSTLEALEVVKQLAEMGCFECALIGGEAYLHPGFFEVVRALRAAGIRPSMTSGGFGITPTLAEAMVDAGLHTVSISVDGLEATHDLMRATKGSFSAACAALEHLKAAGLRTSSNINLNRLNERDFEPLYEHLRDLGISAWQVQLTAPLGRAADRPAMLLQPWDLLTLMPRIAAMKQRAFDEARIVLQPGNNLGFFGPEEALLRSPVPGMTDHFQGCQAGRQLLGIESNGDVKGCPSLQTRHYVGGNLREQPLAELWQSAPQLQFTRHRTVEDLTPASRRSRTATCTSATPSRIVLNSAWPGLRRQVQPALRRHQPEKEEQEYVDAIMDDVQLAGRRLRRPPLLRLRLLRAAVRVGRDSSSNGKAYVAT
jgi:radical SAM protein with 4Fe4S-binding SPASM domain